MGFDLDGKVAVVSGGTTGMGEAAVRAFARAGAKVVLADRDGDAGREIVKSLGGDHVAVFVAADTADPDGARSIVETALNHFGRLDIAFNNTDVRPAPAALADQTAQEFADVLSVNLRGLFNSMRAQIPAMLASDGGGSIINTSSVMGTLAAANESAYVTSNHAVIGLTRGAASDYAAQGVRVNAILPGSVSAAGAQRSTEGAPHSGGQAGEASPAGRAAEPGEVADVVVWLASEQSSYVTGAAIAVDGGVTATL
ncbi:SDR family oxidoreductase (plasmid) [Streptomyces sp. NBC_01136]|uniref:SDR family NAD(P)-dependent oxidoreductase n=1 Tax=unclassified Streptomyces TaxID=2593676 RepID=UPI002F91567F|nr:SDR family oxidoreductase [Streptomyces sp. NBC_01136]